MPPDHARVVLARRRLSPREKWILASVGALFAALLVIVVIALATPGRTSANGCVDVALPYSTGGAEIYRCGAAARTMCMKAGHSDGYSGAAGRAVAGECHKAGLPVG